MHILLLEPYFSGSHRTWAEGLQYYSTHDIEIISLKGQFWKWRMHGGAVSLANEINNSTRTPDLILATSMLDLTTLLSLTRQRTQGVPTAIYFHENQLSYPWPPNDRDLINKRNVHYGFINYVSALTADHVIFNSKYHLNSFLKEAENMLKHFPDYNELNSISKIKKKSDVLHLGIDLSRFDKYKTTYNGPPLILWNHRWEYDKNPEEFFNILFQIKEDDIDFRLVVLGENFNTKPSIFDKAKEQLKKEILHFGFIQSLDEYAKWLWYSDILPVTNNQDFFGASIIEAIYCNTFPLLPKRLTYPELLPKSFQKDHLYKDENDLIKKIKLSMSNISKTRQSEFSSIAKPFDWLNIIPLYDELFYSFLH